MLASRGELRSGIGVQDNAIAMERIVDRDDERVAASHHPKPTNRMASQ